MAKRTKIKDLFLNPKIGEITNVKGWVRTKRGNKNVAFIAINDGSTIKNLQAVADVEKFDEEVLRQITTGACISVNGELVSSQGQGQSVELQVSEIELLGIANPDEYPLQPKTTLVGILKRDSTS